MIAAPVILLGLVASSNAYWLMGIENFITTERIDPIVSPGRISNHVHSVVGGSNFRMSDVTTEGLRRSSCTSVPIVQDKSNYWFPHLYFQCMEKWELHQRERRGRYLYVDLKAVADVHLNLSLDYLFSDKPGTTTAFPDDFRMISGDMTLRSYDHKSYAQQAISYLCLDFNGVTTRHTGIPKKSCPSGIRSQINFPSCWDGKNTDSPDHKSHVAFLSGGPDSGTCSDKRFPITLPRIFIEVYWDSHSFDGLRNQAMNPSQPFVFSHGDSTGYGNHADFVNGWEPGVLQNAVDNCHCNPYGDPTCCANQGIFTLTKGKKCRITKAIDEATTGTLPRLPGNNPVVGEGKPAPILSELVKPALIAPIFAYTGDQPNAVGSVIGSPEAKEPETTISSSSSIASTHPSLSPQTSSHAAATSSIPPASTVKVVHPPAVRPTRPPVRPHSDSSSVHAREQETPDHAESPSVLEGTDDELKASDDSNLTVKTNTKFTKRRRHRHHRFNHNGPLVNHL
ncbi:WSC domain-containing protein [Coprinopsis cinerea okayama7|uniref:WSC domain-containing protein n=1 Tax=Coprinopsis cinerea (strain Okayama-7 / 130 / ATCC MYA-4618 / FGSC 9003) TaxID=240176 RepID=A8NV50_COPC7|nr:WSC domain-containing protein [Coprinopsis cinerea okayama7\|eukprot:XP_001836600.2 WSC domain-containing protein [Coprinopsis cinerea okayama7\